MAVNAALNVALNAALNAVLLQLQSVQWGAVKSCDQMLQVCTHKTIMLGSKGYLSSK